MQRRIFIGSLMALVAAFPYRRADANLRRTYRGAIRGTDAWRSEPVRFSDIKAIRGVKGAGDPLITTAIRWVNCTEAFRAAAVSAGLSAEQQEAAFRLIYSRDRMFDAECRKLAAKAPRLMRRLGYDIDAITGSREPRLCRE